jgi:CheY-like chemotaxis protein
LALLAGRKLLLADDSITIQKVVGLTFADEGVDVIGVTNGSEAIERLEEIAPDVVLADVFMPLASGYQVCEYIKQNEKLRHIPVMLLVGSFEPFDEAEARRVGADDILSKPFQSIRRLIDKVGTLLSGQPAAAETAMAEETATAEFFRPEQVLPEPEKRRSENTEITPADTQPFLHVGPEHSVQQSQARQDFTVETRLDNQKMDRSPNEFQKQPPTPQDDGDVLFELGDFGSTDDTLANDFVLDLDLDAPAEPSPAEAQYSYPTAFGKPVSQLRAVDWNLVRRTQSIAPPAVATFEAPVGAATGEYSAPSVDQLAETQEFPRPVSLADREFLSEPGGTQREIASERQSEPPAAAAQITLDQLSPGVIDEIARRAVEQLAEKIVREIAWEVVPQLSELLIKRQLEEKKS